MEGIEDELSGVPGVHFVEFYSTDDRSMWNRYLGKHGARKCLESRDACDADNIVGLRFSFPEHTR